MPKSVSVSCVLLAIQVLYQVIHEVVNHKLLSCLHLLVLQEMCLLLTLKFRTYYCY